MKRWSKTPLSNCPARWARLRRSRTGKPALPADRHARHPLAGVMSDDCGCAIYDACGRPVAFPVASPDALPNSEQDLHELVSTLNRQPVARTAERCGQRSTPASHASSRARCTTRWKCSPTGPKNWSKSRGWQVVGVYADPHKTGRNSKRDGLQRLIRDIKAGQGGCGGGAPPGSPVPQPGSAAQVHPPAQDVPRAPGVGHRADRHRPRPGAAW